MSEEIKSSFVLYGELEEYLYGIPDADIGKLFRAILRYVNDGELLEQSNGEARMAFKFVKSQLDRDWEKWLEKRKERSASGLKGATVRWGKKNSSAISDKASDGLAINDIATMAKMAVPVNVPVNVPVDVTADAICGTSPRKTKSFKPQSNNF